MASEWDGAIAMDDGIVRRADVYRPRESGRYPASVSYGPYGKLLHFEQLGRPPLGNERFEVSPKLVPHEHDSVDPDRPSLFDQALQEANGILNRITGASFDSSCPSAEANAVERLCRRLLKCPWQGRHLPVKGQNDSFLLRTKPLGDALPKILIEHR